MPNIDVLYVAIIPGITARAEALVARLRQRGFLVGDPVATRRTHHSTTVKYFFTEDRDMAQQLARNLSGTADQQKLDGVRHSTLPPSPGTIRIVLADDAKTAAQPP